VSQLGDQVESPQLAQIAMSGFNITSLEADAGSKKQRHQAEHGFRLKQAFNIYLHRQGKSPLR